MDEIGGYELEPIGGDGAAVRAYRATRRGLGGRAEARVLVSPSECGLARFEQLRPALEGLRSLGERGPATVYDYGLTSEGRLYLACSPEPVTDLVTLLAARGTLEPTVAAQLGADVASEMARAHALTPPLAHGAMHPAAVLLARGGFAHLGGHVLLHEALLRAEDATAALFHVAAYVAPEQVDELTADITTEADVFGLGSLLYEALTGRSAFGGQTPLATTLKVRMAKPPPLDAVDAAAPELGALLRRMWAADRAARPTAAEVSEELRRVAGREVDARRALMEMSFGSQQTEEPPPRAAPKLPSFAAFDDDPTDLSVQLPNYVPSDVAIPLVRGDTKELDAPDVSAPHPTARLDFVEKTEPLRRTAEQFDLADEATTVEPPRALPVGRPTRRDLAPAPTQPLDPPPAPPRRPGPSGPTTMTWVAVAAGALSFLIGAVAVAVWLAS